MSQDQERWLPAPLAVRHLVESAHVDSGTAISLLGGWFHDHRVRFKAAEVNLFMPQEYLDEPYFDESDPDEMQRYSELFGYTHSEEALLRRNRVDQLIDPQWLAQDTLDHLCPVWKTGELVLIYGAVNPAARINYYGVMVNEPDIDRCAALLPPPMEKQAMARAPQQAAAPVGRAPANWWPDFAREVVIEIHENGLPETQSALIAKVQARFSNAGKPEPSRSQIQPVIREIFAAIGPAGNSKP